MKKIYKVLSSVALAGIIGTMSITPLTSSVSAAKADVSTTVSKKSEANQTKKAPAASIKKAEQTLKKLTKKEFKNSNDHDHGLRPGGFSFFSFAVGLPANTGEKGKQRSSFLKGVVEGKVGYRETLAQCLHPSVPTTPHLRQAQGSLDRRTESAGCHKGRMRSSFQDKRFTQLGVLQRLVCGESRGRARKRRVL